MGDQQVETSLLPLTENQRKEPDDKNTPRKASFKEAILEKGLAIMSFRNFLFAFGFCWLAVITFHVTGRGFDEKEVLLRLRTWKEEERKGRQLVGSSSFTNPSTLSAHLANPDMLWPSGIVEYQFYKTFPSNQRDIMREAMDLITNKVSCITFVPATPSSVNFVTIVNGADCSSDLGMKGGEQHIYLNLACFDDGLLTPVQKLLQTLLPDKSLYEPNPEDPLSLFDQVELAWAYNCADSLTKQNLVDYMHLNQELNSLRIQNLENRLDNLSQRGAYCGYRSSWASSYSVISYEKLMLSEGVAGSLNPGTGVWTTNVAGLYQVTWSLQNQLTSSWSKQNNIHLHRNGQQIEVSFHKSWINQDWTSSTHVIMEQGGRVMLLRLAAGDTLNLRTATFQGTANDIHFCVMLLAADRV